MSYSFSQRSLDNLGQAHQDLQTICNYAIKYVDFTIICGHRGEMEQNAAYDLGNSKLRYPKSKHNKIPSLAFDFIPYPFKGWSDTTDFIRVANFIKGIAVMLKSYGAIESSISYGGDWKNFKDYPHIELKS